MEYREFSYVAKSGGGGSQSPTNPPTTPDQGGQETPTPPPQEPDSGIRQQMEF